MNRPVRPQSQKTSLLDLLLWLKWTLMWRGYRRDKMRVLGTVIMLAIFVPISIGLAFLCWELGTNAPMFAPDILEAALGFAYLLWLVTPVLGFPLNEFLPDPTRLFVYPVSYRVIFAAAVLGGLFDFSTLLLFPMLICLLLLFCHSALSAILGLVLIALFLLQTLATAQAVMLALIGFLRSRRFRDITIVLLPLIGLVWYVAQQTLIRRMDLLSTGFRSLVESPIWSAMAWAPSGWTASGMLAVQRGDYGHALLFILMLAIACLVMAAAASYIMHKLYFGDRGPAIKAMRSAETEPQAKQSSAAGLEHTAHGKSARALVPAVMAVVEKEWRYMYREPQYKVLAVNMLYPLVVFVAVFLLNGHSLAALGSESADNPFVSFVHLAEPFAFSGFLLLAALPLVFNIFGGEGPAVTIFFSFPTPRRYFFVGKNLAHASVIGPVCAIGIVAGCYAAGDLTTALLALAWVVFALPVVLAAGNLVSVRFPHSMVIRGQRWGRANQVSLGMAGAGTGAGCGYGFIYLGCYLATFAALLPALAAIVIPLFLSAPAMWYVLTLPLGLAYSLGLYAIGLRVASEWVVHREPMIVEKILPAES